MLDSATNHASRAVSGQQTELQKKSDAGKPRFLSSFFFKVYLFLRERERERERAMSGGRGREKETQNPKQAPGSELSAQSPTRGWDSQTT